TGEAAPASVNTANTGRKAKAHRRTDWRDASGEAGPGDGFRLGETGFQFPRSQAVWVAPAQSIAYMPALATPVQAAVPPHLLSERTRVVPRRAALPQVARFYRR